MLVDELIEELAPYTGRSLSVVIIDEGEAVISDKIGLTITSDYVLEYKDGSKCLSAVIPDGAKVLDTAIGIISKGYYKEEEK